jgi:ABC-type nitrate/sulfonate/bicarbonate transport system substrate-binding protein
MKFSNALAALAGLVLGAQAASAQPLQDVTIGLGSRSLAGGAVRVAKELGLFEKNGVNVNFIFTDNPTIAISGLISKSYDFTVTGFPDFLTAKAKDQDVVVIASTYAGLGINIVLEKGLATKLAIARNAPIEQRLNAMDGLLIAATGPSSTTKISPEAAAKSTGANVRFTFMTYQAMISALDAGAIQGYVAAAPFWVQSVTSGKGVEWISVKDEFKPEFAPTMSSAIGTRADVIARDPALVKKIATVVSDLGNAVRQRPADVKAAMMKVFELDQKTADILFESESRSWDTKPLTVEQVTQEINYLKAYALAAPGVEKVAPASIIYAPK